MGHVSTLLGSAALEEVAELGLGIEAHRHAAFAVRDRDGELIALALVAAALMRARGWLGCFRSSQVRICIVRPRGNRVDRWAKKKHIKWNLRVFSRTADVRREPRRAFYVKLLAPNVACRFVVPQRNELGVPQVIFARPLQELDLRDQHRFQPPAVLYLRCRQARTPSAALRLGEIHERASIEFESAKCLEQLLADDGRKSISSACGVDQTVALARRQLLLPVSDNYFCR
jgi:hypothetical protein